LSYLFTVFHRLNTTGLKLNNQEIRNCIFAGPFNRLLGELDNFGDWRKLNKMKKGEHYRLQKQELILRFFAFQEELEKYSGSLAGFLNFYMETKRFLPNADIQDYRLHFSRSCTVLYDAIQSVGHAGKLSVTLQDALLYAVGKNISLLRELPATAVGEKVLRVINAAQFSETSLAEGLAKKERLKERMRTAEQLLQ